ncbi:MAG: hypothetical protein II558_11380, partial [Treponema sp.]|nr:hypothetical protein [Treponema sp.]
MDILSALRQASVKVFGQGKWLKYFGKLFIFWVDWAVFRSNEFAKRHGFCQAAWILQTNAAFANWH